MGLKMVNLLAHLSAVLLDPIRLLFSYIGARSSTSKWHLILSSLIGAILAEWLLTTTQITRVFGEGIVMGWIGSLLQTFIIFYVFKNKTS